MNNAFYALELSDDQLEMVVGAGGHHGHKGGNGGHNTTTTLSNSISQTSTDVIVQSASVTGAGAATNNAGENGQNILNGPTSQSIF